LRRSIKVKQDRKCYSFKCDRYPKCAVAAGSCCSIGEDAYGEDRIIKDSECFDKKTYPLFVPKK